MKLEYSLNISISILLALMLSCTHNDSEAQLVQFEVIPKAIGLNDLSSRGMFSLTEQQLIPDENGVIAEIKLELPEFQKGVYYRPFTEIRVSGNRMEPLWFEDISELGNYEPRRPRMDVNVDLGTCLMLKKPSGNYLVLLPVVSNRIGSTFSIDENNIYLSVATYGTRTEQYAPPLLAYAESDNPYEAARTCWELVMDAEGVKGNINWRSDKEFPENSFKYLGWCSWEHFKRNISEEIILNALSDIKSSDLPVRWILIDDGYLDVEQGQLLSFGVDMNKFPNGWDRITDQKDEKIKWMGIWRNMNGFMGGVSPEHTMENLREHLVSVPGSGSDRHMPRISTESADAFYHEMTWDTKNNGFDIIKVDFQSDNYRYNKGSENAILGVHYNNTALEEHCVEKDLQLLNCIAQQNFNVFNHRYSSIIRGSIDYKTTKDRFDVTLVQNFANAFWLGHTHWLDQDMFYANFKETAKTMAVARAVSGGPIYLSDETSSIDASSLEPLYFKDGRIMGTLAPGVPLPESLMQDPYFDGEAFRTIAPLDNESAVIFAVNLNHDEKTIEASISEKDYTYAGGLIQPYEGLWELPKEGVLLYDQIEKEATVLDEPYSFELVSRKGQIFQLSPIIDGWSVIGRPDKYLCASGFKLLEIDKKRITIRMMEDGPLMLWTDSNTPVSDNFEFTELSNGLWQGEHKKTNDNKEYSIVAL